MKNIKRTLAFTLAEIVFVMGIIGVVATLTFTNARKDTDVVEKIAQLKKTDEILSTAFAQAVAENGNISNWGTNGTWPTRAQIWEVLAPYLKLKRDCGNSTGCWKSGRIGFLPGINLENGENIDGSNSSYKGILVNGASISTYQPFGASACDFAMLIDVNGKNKGTYRYGDDVFAFCVRRNGQVSAYGLYDADDLRYCLSATGLYCTSWVMKFGNQDYMKPCKNQLSWNDKHSCR